MGFKRKGLGRADWMGFKRVAAASNACVSEAMTFDLERLLTAKSIPDQVARLTCMGGFLFRLLTLAKKTEMCLFATSSQQESVRTTVRFSKAEP